MTRRRHHLFASLCVVRACAGTSDPWNFRLMRNLTPSHQNECSGTRTTAISKIAYSLKRGVDQKYIYCPSLLKPNLFLLYLLQCFMHTRLYLDVPLPGIAPASIRIFFFFSTHMPSLSASTLEDSKTDTYLALIPPPIWHSNFSLYISLLKRKR